LEGVFVRALQCDLIGKNARDLLAIQPVCAEIVRKRLFMACGKFCPRRSCKEGFASISGIG
jgi:hypothetical protein